MASSPYAHVPAAATTLARRLRPLLNTARAENGLAPVPLLRVDRISTSAGDYGTLSAQARDLHMATNTLSFRRLPSALVRDAHLLVVDDVRVTGAHQRCLMRASEDLPLTARTFLYIAAFPGLTNGCSTPGQKTHSTTPPSRRSTTWPASWKTTTSPGTSASASCALNPANTVNCRGSCAGCPAGSSATCTVTAAGTATARMEPTPRVTPSSARN